MKKIKDTFSLCPKCLDIIKASVIIENDNVYLYKICKKHGKFKAKHIWDKKKLYKKMFNLPANGFRQGNCLVLNLTTKCDIKCPFCYMSANEGKSYELSIENIKKILSIFKGDIIYLSGGEPLVRKDIFKIIKTIKNADFKLGIFTNGLKLADESYVRKLKENNIDMVMLQFDTLKDNNYKFLRGQKLLTTKLKAIKNLKKYNISVYLFSMLVKDVNFDEIDDLLTFALQNNIKIINFNPVWEIGRLKRHKVLYTSDILYKVKDCLNIDEDDFLDSTAFAYYFFNLLQKFRGKNTNTQPRCELRMYLFYDKNEIIPITKFIDIKKLNSILKNIVNNSKTKIEIFKELTLNLPILTSLIVKSLTKKESRKIFRIIIKNTMNILKNNKFFIPITSVIIGTFETSDNIDFDTLKTCNLYSDFEDKNFIFSACLRQILKDKNYDFSKFEEKFKKEKILLS